MHQHAGHDDYGQETKKRLRRNHTPALKAQILAECAAAGASVAKVAMAHGINANIVHGWRKQAREQGATPVVAPAFMPLAIEATPGADERSTRSSAPLPPQMATTPSPCWLAVTVKP